MSYQIFNEASLGKFIELIKNKVKSMVDNANVASATNATNATNDADGNAIKTTYRKISDSYSKSEVDAKVGKSSSSITITTDDLIANYTYPKLLDLLESGNTVYLKLTNNDPVHGMVGSNEVLSLYEYWQERIVWGTQFDFNGAIYTLIVRTSDTNADSSIPLSYMMIPTNTLTEVSTINIAVAAWDSASKTTTVTVYGVTADNAVDVAPAGSSFDDYVNAGIRATAQGDNTLTFKCKTIPTKIISVNIKVVTTKAISSDRNYN